MNLKKTSPYAVSFTYDAAGTAVTKRFFAAGEQRLVSAPGAAEPGFASYYYTRDHLGSVREVLDATGHHVARYEYDAYGRRTTYAAPGQLPPPDDFGCEFGFTGHFTHAATGLTLTLHRAYDPETGRWLSVDPIWENGGVNLYGYVGGSPLMAVDPLGLVDLNYTDGKDSGCLFDDDRVFTIHSHGRPGNLLKNGRVVSMRDLIDDMYSHGYKDGTPVIVYACESATPGGMVIGESEAGTVTRSKEAVISYLAATLKGDPKVSGGRGSYMIKGTAIGRSTIVSSGYKNMDYIQNGLDFIKISKGDNAWEVAQRIHKKKGDIGSVVQKSTGNTGGCPQ